MKKIIWFLILVFLTSFVYTKRDYIVKLYDVYFVPIEKKITKLEKNEYYRNIDYAYIQNTTKFIPDNKQDIMNIYYTVVNSGMNEFTFYCKKEYSNCLTDVNDLINDQNALSNINNFVHPYNSFKSIDTIISSTGKITLKIKKIYNNEMIILLNYKVDEIIKEKIKAEDDLRTKIKKIHDYIINHTKYDKNRSDKKDSKYQSDNAYGVLIENYGICGGYTDAMMLFLEKFKVPNIKISTENHIWNYVEVDDKWWHLDLTWDDPVAENGKDILDDAYFLITEETLKSIEKEEHNYDKKIYEQEKN